MDHFIVYKNTESLWCSPKTYIILDVNYNSIKKKRDSKTFRLRRNDLILFLPLQVRKVQDRKVKQPQSRSLGQCVEITLDPGLHYSSIGYPG